MPLGPLHSHRSSNSSSEDYASEDESSSGTADQVGPTTPTRTVSRRRFLAGVTATASVSLAGCTARLPGKAASVDSRTTRDGNTLIWAYPASAAESDQGFEGIGYAAIRFQVFNMAVDADSVIPALQFRLNSTVADLAAGESYQGYQADSFRFYIGVPRTYDGAAGLRAFVQPPQWPDIRTTYGYTGAVRELAVQAPDVHEDGTIIVEGRFQPYDATLPSELHCGFEVQASQSGPLGRTVRVDGRETFDVSVIDLPEGITTA
ncbi:MULTISPECIES: hypothetical protein [Halorubrum]|uniref:Uncharacterized protein n=1 Tax=Halorubrum sodomense TaxID=35743 RepID=A0A1I6G3R5_HALSD|nr:MULTISPECIES: hypothetical protein [Halorubrum]TKX53192.1 hypothetical protein EXE42_13880 [Halorubrum sp. SP3]TKX55680.1 hypothetical protein EXE44_16030 [Halorubrum sp. SS7]SFR36848.1 hypothetical protein SAMN04487937_1590 [Halorubrum sodomense]